MTEPEWEKLFWRDYAPHKKGRHVRLLFTLSLKHEMTLLTWPGEEGKHPVIVPRGTIGRIRKAHKKTLEYQVEFPGYPGDELPGNPGRYQVAHCGLRVLTPLELLAETAED